MAFLPLIFRRVARNSWRIFSVSVSCISRISQMYFSGLSSLFVYHSSWLFSLWFSGKLLATPGISSTLSWDPIFNENQLFFFNFFYFSFCFTFSSVIRSCILLFLSWNTWSVKRKVPRRLYLKLFVWRLPIKRIPNVKIFYPELRVLQLSRRDSRPAVELKAGDEVCAGVEQEADALHREVLALGALEVPQLAQAGGGVDNRYQRAGP